MTGGERRQTYGSVGERRGLLHVAGLDQRQAAGG